VLGTQGNENEKLIENQNKWMILFNIQ